jgi:hypothetical protein
MGVEGLEIGLGCRRDLRRGQVGRVLRNHQGGGVERGLHGGAGVVGPRIVDGRADHAEDRQQGECECHRDIGFGVAPKALK